MTNKKLPEKSYLLSRLKYDPETGKLYWLKFDRKNKSWNTKYSGKEAFTANNGTGYRHGSIDNVNYLAHRIIYKIIYDDEPQEVDHINGDRSDNRIENLRYANKSTNQMNAKKRINCSSVYKGVHFFKRDSNWAVMCNRKHIGYFKTEIEAAMAYKQAAQKEFGDYAYQATAE